MNTNMTVFEQFSVLCSCALYECIGRVEGEFLVVVLVKVLPSNIFINTPVLGRS